MTDPFQKLSELLEPAELRATIFPPSSRYHGIGLAQLTRPDATLIVFLRRRFVPQPERFATLQEHTVAQGDRLDRLAARYLGDPEQFWQICDANGVIRPDELIETIGRRLRITMPEGISGGAGG